MFVLQALLAGAVLLTQVRLLALSLRRASRGSIQVSDWTDYIGRTQQEIHERLAVVQGDLATLHSELAFARQREVEAKSSAWQNSTEGTVTGRERDARIAATPHSVTILDLEGKRAVLDEEKSFLLMLERSCLPHHSP